MAFIKLVLLFILVTLTLCGDSRDSYKRGVSSIGKRFGKSHRGSYSINRNGISRNRLGILFPTAMALGGIYIGSQMRSHVHLRSYRDLDRYTVCDGRPMLAMGSTSMTYSYFLCPDDPNQPFERYCCTDENGNGYCCSYDVKRGGIFGGIFGALIFIGVVATIAYCCCCRKRRQMSHKPTPTTLFVPSAAVHGGSPGMGPSMPIDTADPPPIPGMLNVSSPPYPMYPQGATTGLPYPSGPNLPPYNTTVPSATTGGVPQPPTVGSGWADARSPTAMPGRAPPDDPPPYHSVVAAGPVSTPYPMP